ncbi:MAG: hypothetical protein WA947_18585 [Phormidesmis sp.]
MEECYERYRLMAGLGYVALGAIAHPREFAAFAALCHSAMPFEVDPEEKIMSACNIPLQKLY